MGLGLRLTPDMQEPYSYRAVARYTTLNSLVDSENNNQGESNMIKEKFIKNP